MKRAMAIMVATLTMAGALSGCAKPAELAAEGAWVRLPAVPGRPASGYAVVTGADRPAVLLRVSADAAIRTEMHESMAMAGGMTTMRPIDSIPLPAQGRIVFAPGGRHLMLFGINSSVKPGGTMILTFSFGDGTRVQRKATVVAAGDPEPR